MKGKKGTPVSLRELHRQMGVGASEFPSFSRGGDRDVLNSNEYRERGSREGDGFGDMRGRGDRRTDQDDGPRRGFNDGTQRSDDMGRSFRGEGETLTNWRSKPDGAASSAAPDPTESSSWRRTARDAAASDEAADVDNWRRPARALTTTAIDESRPSIMRQQTEGGFGSEIKSRPRFFRGKTEGEATLGKSRPARRDSPDDFSWRKDISKDKPKNEKDEKEVKFSNGDEQLGFASRDFRKSSDISQKNDPPKKTNESITQPLNKWGSGKTNASKNAPGVVDGRGAERSTPGPRLYRGVSAPQSISVTSEAPATKPKAQQQKFQPSANQMQFIKPASEPIDKLYEDIYSHNAETQIIFTQCLRDMGFGSRIDPNDVDTSTYETAIDRLDGQDLRGIVPSLIALALCFVSCYYEPNVDKCLIWFKKVKPIIECLRQKSSLEKYNHILLCESVKIAKAMNFPTAASGCYLIEVVWDSLSYTNIMPLGEIIEWYEDIADSTPGRHEALFQIVSWIQWLTREEEIPQSRDTDQADYEEDTYAQELWAEQPKIKIKKKSKL